MQSLLVAVVLLSQTCGAIKHEHMNVLFYCHIHKICDNEGTNA